jgi:S-adenosylmethionine:tRNA ribosyltransferase-isomerase
MMKTTDFDYDLPSKSIAQTPVEPRDASRLLVIDRRRDELTHTHFHAIGAYLRAGDLLVLNETRVIPARLFGRKVPSGGRVELLLLRREDAQTWEALVGGKGLTVGRRVALDGLEAEVVADLGGSRRRLHFSAPLDARLDGLGQAPLPPYIHIPLADPERYQTVYAREAGSAAAPTAGLHFTARLLDELAGRGVGLARVTLHVGLDTFAPVTEDSPQEHQIHTEWCALGPETAAAIEATTARGGRVVAVGTTSVRTLETAARAARQTGSTARVIPFTGPTDLFILPPYAFQAVDAMITNFHLPRSTLLMLVSAFAGRERMLAAYAAAVQAGYRFYSFGDAMLIL